MTKYLSTVMIVALSAVSLLGGDAHSSFLKETFPLLPSEDYKWIKVVVVPDSPIPCPPKLINEFLNKKLFSLEEANLVKEAFENYQEITTNSWPRGAVLSKWAMMRPAFSYYTNLITVAFLQCANSRGTDEIAFLYDNQKTIVRHRTKPGEGYNLVLNNGKIELLQEYRNEVLDGMFLGFSERGKLLSLARFSEGKAKGAYYAWDSESRLSVHFELKKPLDLMKYQFMQFCYSWTNSINN